MKNFFKLLYVSILCSLFVLSFSVIGKASENTLIIENMKTDNLLEPLGIDSEYPVFSWNLSDPETRGQKQTSYRIMIALSEDDLTNGIYVWDSGVIRSAETANITYSGDTLEASTRYFWQLEIGDKDGNKVSSEIS